MPNKETKRQHYVPRTYLKHFSTERSGEYFIGTLPVSDIKEENIRKINIANVCLQKDLYTLPGVTSEERMLIENFYNENYETHYDKIYHLLTDPNKKTVTDEERELIISTVVTMLFRTTKSINTHHKTWDNVLDSLYQLCQQTGKDYFIFEEQKISIAGKSLEQLKKEYRDDSRPELVLSQLRVALDLINLRIKRDGIYVSKLVDHNNEFLTSDNPVNFVNVKGGRMSPFDPENILTLPLDSKHVLSLLPISEERTKNIIVRHNSTGIGSISEKLSSNYQQFQNAERFILGSEMGLKNYLKVKTIYEKPLTDEEMDNIKSYNDLLTKVKEIGLF